MGRQNLSFVNRKSSRDSKKPLSDFVWDMAFLSVMGAFALFIAKNFPMF